MATEIDVQSSVESLLAISYDLQRIATPNAWLHDDDIISFIRLCVCSTFPHCSVIHPQLTNMMSCKSPTQYAMQLCDGYILETIDPNSWRYLYLPCNINNQHWVLYVVDRIASRIYFYDSLASANFDHHEQDNGVYNVLGRLQAIHGDLHGEMTIIEVSDCGQQRDSSSCGIFVCHYTRSHALGLSLSTDANYEESELRRGIFESFLEAVGLNASHSKRLKAKIGKRHAIKVGCAKAVDAKKRKMAEQKTESFKPADNLPSHIYFNESQTKQVGNEFHKAFNCLIKNSKECQSCREAFPGMTFKAIRDDLCRRCKEDKKFPKLLSNDNFCDPGDQPECLKVLTVVEQMLISPLLPSCQIFNISGHGRQRGGRGHVITFPQHVHDIATQLPRRTLPIVLMVKNVADANIHLRVRRAVVEEALVWLKKNNPFFKDISCVDSNFSNLPIDGVFHGAIFISDGNPEVNNAPLSNADDLVLDSSTLLQLPLRDMEANLRERLMKEALLWPHVDHHEPINEFHTPGLFTRSFPHLFPTGAGDYSLPRCRSLSLGDYVKHLIRYRDSRFRRDERFVYFAMNLLFRWRALSYGRVYLKMHPEDSTLSPKQLLEKLKNPGFLRKVLAFSGSLHGSQSYWWNQCNRVEAMCEALGPPTFFVTLSAADTYWPDLKELFDCSSVEEMPRALRENPAVADSFFTHRAELFINHFFKTHLRCKDYYFRVEYQHRGSPHVHGIVWMPDAPSIIRPPVDCEAVEKYADEYISTWNPLGNACELPTGGLFVEIHPASKSFSDIESKLCLDYCQIVNTCLRHTRCRLNRCLIPCNPPGSNNNTFLKKCRFGFPKELQEKTSCKLLPESRGSYELTTKRNDPLVVSHCPQLTVVWRANSEVQMVVSVSALVRYLLKYLNKPEPASEALQKIQETLASESTKKNITAKHVIQSVLISTVGNRDYSAQESSHHLLGLPLYFCSRTFEVVNTSGLRAIGSEGTVSNYLDIYSKRCMELEEICLFNYVRLYSKPKRQGVLPPKRRKEVVVQIKPKYKRSAKSAEVRQLWFRQQLVLFLPWRVQEKDLKGDFNSWEEAFLSKQEVIEENKRACSLCFSMTEQLPTEHEVVLLDETAGKIHDDDDVGSKEIVGNVLEDDSGFGHCLANVGVSSLSLAKEQEPWMMVQEEPGRLFFQAKSVTLDVFQDLVDPNYDWSLHQVTHRTPYDNWLQQERNSLSERQLTRVEPETLNGQQGIIFDRVKEHASQVTDDVESQKQQPFKAIILGKAGTGKSHLIHALRTLLGNQCILLAPTGVAACNVQGSTIHSKLSIPVTSGMSPLTSDALMQLQENLRHIKYVMIDEISMVGQSLLGKVDSRLREVFPQHGNIVFGGRSMLLFGDFGQLPPVCDKSVYSSPQGKKSKVKSQKSFQLEGYLAYISIEECHFLETVIRQEDDNGFRDLLMRIHDGKILEEDWRCLCQRCDFGQLALSDSPFFNCLRLFPKHSQVFEHNLWQIKKLKNSGQAVAVIQAEHPSGDARAIKASADDAGGLESVVALCIGSRVMLIHNLWVEMGLVNGTMGTVNAILYESGKQPPSLPAAVMVHFDTSYTGPRILPDNVVPITPRQFCWNDKGHLCSRVQLPLTLCWATTIHKSQGLTLDKVVLNLGSRDFCPGLSYVALSRVRRLTDLCLYPVDWSRLKAINESSALKDRKAEEERLRKLANR